MAKLRKMLGNIESQECILLMRLIETQSKETLAACAAVSTPTNALGFLFYGAAAIAYSKEGLTQSAEVYDAAASLELNRAYESLKDAAVPDEQHPAKIKWYC